MLCITATISTILETGFFPNLLSVRGSQPYLTDIIFACCSSVLDPIQTCWPSNLMQPSQLSYELDPVQPVPFLVTKQDGRLVHTCALTDELHNARVRVKFILQAYCVEDCLHITAQDRNIVILEWNIFASTLHDAELYFFSSFIFSNTETAIKLIILDSI